MTPYIRRGALLAGLMGLLMLVIVGTAAAANVTVETGSPTGPGVHEVTVTGKVSNSASTTIYAFEYGTTTSYGYETKPTFAGSGVTQAQALLPELTPSTTYHYRIGAVNTDGSITYGADKSFTTLAAPAFISPISEMLTLKGAGNNWRFELPNSASVACTKASGAAEGLSSTWAELVPSTCSVFGTFPGTVNMNGCRYFVKAGKEGEFSIACPPGNLIEVSSGICATTIPAQTGSGFVSASNIAGSEPNKVKLTFQVSNLKYTKTKDGFGCSLDGTGSGEDAVYAGSLEVSAFNASGSAVSFWAAN